MLPLQVRQKHREQPDQREETANAKNILDTRVIRELAHERRTDTSNAKGEAEEEAGNQPHFAWHEFLGENDDGRKSRGENDPDDCGEDDGRREPDIRKDQCERGDAENRKPNDVLAAEAIAEWAADDGTGGYGEQKNEKIDLCLLDRAA